MSHSIEAEQAVLGACMIDPRKLDDVVDLISDRDFYSTHHQIIFNAMLANSEAGKPIDPVSVAESLDNGRKELEQVGGLSYIASLADNRATASNAKAYAKTVKAKATVRRIAQAGIDINELTDSLDLSPEAMLDRAGAILMDLTPTKSAGPQRVGSELSAWVDRVEDRFSRGGSITGISTGFLDIDKRLSGLNSGDLIIVAGRPSMGKTSFAMNIAEHAAVNDKIPTLVFSMEMPTDQLLNRIHSSIGRVPLGAVRDGSLNDEHWKKLTEAMGRTKDAPLWIDETPALTPHELRSRARIIKRQHGLGLVVVDYLQLMQTGDRKENRTGEISEISRSLKALAKELECPVIALSQLNRGLEQRPDKRPKMSDLRESGAIEQDADVIMFIYRDEVYHDDSPDKGTAEIITAKQRNGEIGKNRLAFNGQFTRFDNFGRGC